MYSYNYCLLWVGFVEPAGIYVWFKIILVITPLIQHFNSYFNLLHREKMTEDQPDQRKIINRLIRKL